MVINVYLQLLPFSIPFGNRGSSAFTDINLHWLLIGEPHKMLNHKDGTGYESRAQENMKNPAELLREALKQLENKE